MRPLLCLAITACSSPSTSPPTNAPVPRDAVLLPADAIADPRRWFAGDVHMHVAPPDDPDDVALSIHEIAQAAARAGMDFVVLTPHLWRSRWTRDRDRWRTAWRQLASDASAIVAPTMIPGVEWSTRAGHFTVAGADLAALSGADFLAAAERAGAWISVNHPFAVPTRIPGIRVSHYDISYRPWTHRAPGFTAIDAAEVWNVPLALANLVSRPGGATGEDRTWSEMNRVVHAERRRMTAVAGTDNHQTNVMATTWVLAIDASAAAILQALRDGATCIGGPEAGTLRARGDGDWVAIGGVVRGPVTTLEWQGTARVYVDNVDHGEHTGHFTHETEGALHTYRIEIGRSRSGFVYANL